MIRFNNHKILALGFFLLAAAVVGCTMKPEHQSVSSSEYQLIDFLETTDSTSFRKAVKKRRFQFPGDLGPHPHYKTEWWYYTGNLKTGGGRRFGYELTIFRSGLIPGRAEADSMTSDWRTRHLYMGHLALSDIKNETFYSFEKYSRGAAGLAGARAKPFRVWLEDWQIKASARNAPPGSDIPVMRLTASEGPVGLDLTLASKKRPVLQGDQGLDRKGPGRGNASYYFSLTRMKTSGTIALREDTFKVSGSSWMDREWSTSALAEDQVGWDWFALQLNNGYEIMYYRLRQKNGESSPYSNGVIVGPNGEQVPLGPADITLEPEGHWTSPSTGARYPVRWSIRIPEKDIAVNVIPLMDNQELQTRFKYWEGAVRIEGTFRDSTVTGRGYVELTGYAGKVM